MVRIQTLQEEMWISAALIRQCQELQDQVDRLQTQAWWHAMQWSSLESVYAQKLHASRHDRDRLAVQLGAANQQIAMRDAALAAFHKQASEVAKLINEAVANGACA